MSGGIRAVLVATALAFAADDARAQDIGTPNGAPPTQSLILKGGTVDRNLVGIYQELQTAGKLPVKQIQLDPEKSLSSNLLQQRVLFANFPLEFENVLVELNKGSNPSVTVNEAQVAGKKIRWKEGSYLLVPDLDPKPIPYTTVLQPGQRDIRAVAYEHGLLRCRVDDSGTGCATGRYNEGWKREVEWINRDTPVPASGDRPRIVPAEGVKIEVPAGTVPTLPSSPNVVLANPASSQFFWNYWSTTPASPSKLVDLQVGKPGRIVVDLSYLDYSFIGNAVQAASPQFADWLKKVQGDVKLDVVILPDPEVFDLNSPNPQSFFLSAQKLQRLAANGPIPHDGSILEAIRTQPKPEALDFRLGTVNVDLLPKQDGRSTVALAFFSHGRALETLYVSLCVGGACAPSALSDSPRDPHLFAPAVEVGTPPDAGLYVTELPTTNDEKAAVGVFYNPTSQACAATGGYCYWKIGKSFNLEESLRSFVVSVADASRPDQLRKYGQELAKVLFGEALERTGFADFIRSSAQLAPDGRRRLSVRVALWSRPVPPIVPLGLLDVSPEASATPVFVGRSVTLEFPLGEQDYTLPDQCLKTWTVALPAPEDNNSRDVDAIATNAALRGLGTDAHDRWVKIATNKYYDDKNMGQLRKWFVESGPRTDAFFLLSHHDSARIFYTRSAVLTANPIVGDGFAAPTLAVLDACSTASSYEDGWVERLNRAGTKTVIATVSSTDAELAGSYGKCLLRVLDAAPVAGVTAAKLNEDVTKCLWEASVQSPEPKSWDTAARAATAEEPVDDGPRFDVNALKFFVVGNLDTKIAAQGNRDEGRDRVAGVRHGVVGAGLRCRRFAAAVEDTDVHVHQRHPFRCRHGQRVQEH